jgi:hypothetical protein
MKVHYFMFQIYLCFNMWMTLEFEIYFSMEVMKI